MESDRWMRKVQFEVQFGEVDPVDWSSVRVYPSHKKPYDKVTPLGVNFELINYIDEYPLELQTIIFDDAETEIDWWGPDESHFGIG